MHAVTPRRDPQEVALSLNTIPFDPVLCKFISTIQSSQEIKDQCANRTVLTWMRVLDEEVKLGNSKYTEKVQDCLKLNPKIEEVKAIASIYAKILSRHVPRDNGRISHKFYYYDLVSCVKTVFEEHIAGSVNLLSSGIEIPLKKNTFYGKMEKGKVYLFFKTGVVLGKGGYGRVSEIYDVVSRRLYAFKESFNSQNSLKAMEMEISSLNQLHQQAEALGHLSVEGLQSPPRATLDIFLKGYIGTKYKCSLLQWTLEFHTNAERVAMCKLVMHAFKHKTALGFWHGDLKLDNFLIKGKHCALIDWAGSILFQKASEELATPAISSSDYIDYNHNICLKELLKILELQMKGDKELNERFIQLAHERELFAMAMVLFKTLVPFKPFRLISDGDRNYCDVAAGLNSEGKENLMNRNYSEEVIQVITKMLSKDSKDRYSDLEAIEAWEKIEVV